MSLQIIIPVYNTENFIRRCFNSLIVESLKYIKKHDISVLFVNDGSTDASQKVIDELKENYDFVDSIYQENQGLSVARNTGIKQINAKYYSLLDSDDWLVMSKFCELYEKMLVKNLDFISYSLSYYNENYEFTGHRANQNVVYNQVCTGIEFLEQGYQPSSACLFIYHRDFILENELWYYPRITQQDVEHTFRMMLQVKKGLFLDTKIYNYYRRSGSSTLPSSKEKLKKYLSDSIIVANQIYKNMEKETVFKHKNLIVLTKKNYNSVIWNLLWRFLSNPKEVDYEFKLKCLDELKRKKLYPIKGGLKTPFQKVSTLLFNQEFFLKQLFKFR